MPEKTGGVFAALALILSAVGILSGYLLWDASTSFSHAGDQYLPVMQLSTSFEREILAARAEFTDEIDVQKSGAREAGWSHFHKARELGLKLQDRVAASGDLSVFAAPVGHSIPDLNAYEVLLGRILDAVKNRENQGTLFAALVKDWARVDGRLADTAAEVGKESGELAEQTALRHAGRLFTGARIAAAVCLLGGILGTMVGWGLLRDMRKNLTTAARELNAVAEHFSIASGEVASASKAVAEGTAEQASSLGGVSASCLQLESLNRQGESNADLLAGVAAESREASEAGVAAAGRMRSSFDEVRSATGRVSEIVGAVDQIAFRTSLLAVKAAVEAHRSAEAARALSALASEANELAQRSALSARETAAAVEATTAAAADGTAHAEAVTETLCYMAEKAYEAQDLAREIGSAGGEQTRGLGQLAHAISQIEEVTRTVTADAGRNMAASDEIRSRAAGVKRIARDLAELGGAELGSADRDAVERRGPVVPHAGYDEPVAV